MLVMRKQWLAAFLSLTIVTGISGGQAVPAEKADEARIDRLLRSTDAGRENGSHSRRARRPGRVSGSGRIPARRVRSLHIPSLRFADGPPGLLTRVPAQAETATMGVAATFSTKDAEANGVVIGREARSLGIDVVLAALYQHRS